MCGGFIADMQAAYNLTNDCTGEKSLVGFRGFSGQAGGGSNIRNLNSLDIRTTVLYTVMHAKDAYGHTA